MHKSYIVRLLPGLFAVCSISCSPKHNDIPFNAILTPAEAHADYRRMREVLEQGAPSLYRYHDKSEVARRFDAGDAQIIDSMTPLRLWQIAAPVIASLGDAHMSLMPGNSINDHIYGPGGRVLPLRVRIIDGRLFTIRSYLTDGPQAGAEIVSIDGLATSQVLDRCTRTIPVDGAADLRRYRKLEREFDSWCGTVMNLPAEYTLGYKPSGSDTIRTARIPAITWDSLRKARTRLYPADSVTRVEPQFEFRVGDAAQPAVMMVRSFSKSDGFNPSREFAAAFRKISEAGAKNLIIDIRGNGGGRDTNAALLYGYMATDSFSYISSRIANGKRFGFLRKTDDWFLNFMLPFIRTKSLPDGRVKLNMGIDRAQQPRDPRFRGRVFVLTDARTFSTASEFATLVKLNRRGVIVGEETGNAYGGDSGAVVSYTLENSGLVINIPLVQYNLPSVREPGASRAVMPDVAVGPTIEDLLQERDVVMERALQLSRDGQG